MSATPTSKGGLRLLGLGALACIGCCAGPVLAFLGGVSIAGLASTTLIGGAGLLIAAVAAVAYLVVRRRRTSACSLTLPVVTPVAAPTRRDPTTGSEEVTVP